MSPGIKNVCSVCAKGKKDADDPDHLASAEHRFNFKLFEWNQYRNCLVKDRDGIKITVSPMLRPGNNSTHEVFENSGKHCTILSTAEFQNLGYEISHKFRVTNCASYAIYFMNVNMLHPLEAFKIVDEGQVFANGRTPQLEPGASYEFVVSFRLRNSAVCDMRMPIACSFQNALNSLNAKVKKPFTIAREMVIIIRDETWESRGNNQKSPFTKLNWENVKYIPSTSEQFTTNLFPIPPHYKRILFAGLEKFKNMTPDDVVNLAYANMAMEPGFPTKKNYADFFHILLWLEEIGQRLMLSRYNMENVYATRVQDDTFELEVPGLAENRPSLVEGDEIIIRIHSDHVAYRGYISKINDKTIWFKHLNHVIVSILETTRTEMDVSFGLGRLSFERMHEGIENCVLNNLHSTLFPSVDLLNQQVGEKYKLDNHSFFNPNIVNNDQQRTAIKNILNGTSRHAPYIVFGPPGTGKTVTIVETILQIKKRIANARILVCAQSNAACDMLATKLVPNCGAKELIRVHSATRDWNTVPKEIRSYSNRSGNEYTKISASQLNSYRIVITTLTLSGKYNDVYRPNFVFIDEAAQAMEPEAAIAIGRLQKSGTQVVLAGDPKQLGPFCSSSVAEKRGLCISLLERLMKTDLYASKNPNFMVKLIKNFRSHPTVLQVPNQLFYDNELQAVSKSALNDPISKVFVFPKEGKKNKTSRGEAVEFYSVIAKEKREGQSPSYFNEAEIEVVTKYVKALMSNENIHVKPSDIGIVTPYKRQMHRIKNKLQRLHYSEVEVGTTEAFQGREKRIIIISTVRAQHSLLLFDKKYNLGFVSHEKRFNVALTRAQSKLIVVGCPLVLNLDINWNTFIKFCEDRDACFGAPFLRRTGAVRTDIVARLTSVMPDQVSQQHMRRRPNQNQPRR